MGGPQSGILAGASVDEVLAHFGVKGMRWGQRKAEDSIPAQRTPPSHDAVAAAVYKDKVKSGGTNALTTKELQDLVNRMNLEQQYGRMSPEPTNAGRKYLLKTMPKMALVGAQFALKNNEDPKVKMGLMLAGILVGGKQK